MSETGAAAPLYRDCPHCGGEGFVTARLPASSPLLKYLDSDMELVKACPHCIRRGVVPAAPPKSSGPSRDTLGHNK